MVTTLPKTKKLWWMGILLFLLFGGGFFVVRFLGLGLYAQTIINNQALVLQGNESLEIVDTHYIQKNNIILKDNARLTIRDSLFEHRQDFSAEFTLEAEDTAQLIIENSEVRSSAWLNWNFRDQTRLTLNHVRQTFSDVWHSFSGQARAVVTDSKFNGTLGGEASFAIEDSPSTFLELVLPVGAIVDEELPKKMIDYSFPNTDENNIGLDLTVKNSTASSWGITVNPRSTVTIRDTSSLVVTLAVGLPWEGITATLENLRPMTYHDQSWEIEDMVVRLVNVTTGKWSPIVGGNNTLIVKNSDLSDNAFSSGNAKIVIENSTASFLKAQEFVEMTVRDSVIGGDVVAVDNAKITLVNTTVGGKIIEKDDGKIVQLR